MLRAELSPALVLTVAHASARTRGIERTCDWYVGTPSNQSFKAT
ncbi:MAG: hypothetical protein ABW167_16595 [Baekduia sp.]